MNLRGPENWVNTCAPYQIMTPLVLAHKFYKQAVGQTGPREAAPQYEDGFYLALIVDNISTLRQYINTYRISCSCFPLCRYNNLFQHINKSLIRHPRLSIKMTTLTKAVVKQMSAHKLTNKVVANGMGLGIGLHRRFHTTQARYLFITNAGLLLLTSLLRGKPFTKICHPSLWATSLTRAIGCLCFKRCFPT